MGSDPAELKDEADGLILLGIEQGAVIQIDAIINAPAWWKGQIDTQTPLAWATTLGNYTKLINVK